MYKRFSKNIWLTFMVTILITIIVTGCTNIVDTPSTTSSDSDTKADKQEVVLNEANTYINNFYNFSITFPKNLEYCLNDFCQNDIEDKDLQHFKIDSYQLLKYLGIKPTKGTPTLSSIEIAPRKNLLNMSAIDFAKRSLKLNRQYRSENDYYSQEGETIFAGESAFEFTATGGFEERGAEGAHDESGTIAVKDSTMFIEKAGQGRSLEEPHRVIYLDHNGTMYRILYPINNKTAVEIMSSFKFTD